ncbi:hypothetical protein TNCV_31421 [Trichonephila clavipes]|nr:hypothetical protein TNCV_31421 [Trichonephila clavipes]
MSFVGLDLTMSDRCHEQQQQVQKDKNDNLRNPLKTPSAENAVSSRLFAFPEKILIIEPVWKSGFQRIFLLSIVDHNTMKKLEVDRTLEKSDHPCSMIYVGGFVNDDIPVKP